MSDTSQGEGWWLASDGKWYPPPAPVAPPPPPGAEATSPGQPPASVEEPVPAEATGPAEPVPPVPTPGEPAPAEPVPPVPPVEPPPIEPVPPVPASGPTPAAAAPGPAPGAPVPPGPDWSASPGVAPGAPGAEGTAPAPAQPYVATIGDIGITETLVVTPSGTGPLPGSQWVLTDFTHTDSKIPTWAIVLAVVFALACLLGLLFLLVKEQTTTGYVEISVRTTDGVYHVTRIPVQDQNQLNYWRNMVAWAQGVAVRP